MLALDVLCLAVFVIVYLPKIRIAFLETSLPPAGYLRRLY